jgi:hypothetical protein
MFTYFGGYSLLLLALSGYSLLARRFAFACHTQPQGQDLNRSTLPLFCRCLLRCVLRSGQNSSPFLSREIPQLTIWMFTVPFR